MELPSATQALDLAKLQAQREPPATSGVVNSEAELEAVAREFESLFVNMMMKSMRAATRVLSDGNIGSSNEIHMFEDMLDEKLSVQMAERQGLGLADMIVRQLGGLDRESSTRVNDAGFRVAPTRVTRPESPSGPESSVQAPTRKAGFGSIEEFVQQLLPAARTAAHSLAVAPEVLLSHAALETGWGQRLIHDGAGRNGHNLFGMKAGSDWLGDSIGIRSIEVSGGQAQPVMSRFRQYPDYESSFADLARFLRERYDAVTAAGSDIAAYGAALQAGGYATDPEYAAKLERVATHPALQRLEP